MAEADVKHLDLDKSFEMFAPDVTFSPTSSSLKLLYGNTHPSFFHPVPHAC